MQQAMQMDLFRVWSPRREPRGLTRVQSEVVRDKKKQESMRDRVLKLLADGKRRRLYEISALMNGSDQVVGARIRDLRKRKYGAWPVISKRIDGIWWYWMKETDLG